MNMHQLEVLAQVAQHGSFSGAALALDTSQAAVSRAIAALERELGVPLLNRGRFGARLTPVGERILNHGQKILDLREMIEYEANLEKGLYGGRVRIASFRSAATHVLPPHIAQFRDAYPKVEVSISERDPAGVEQALRSGQADIGLVPLPRSSEEFDTWEIARDEYVVLLPKTFTWGDQSLSWEVLSSHTFILYNYAECTSTVRDYWAARGHSLQVAYEIREDSTIVSMVAQGLGAAILPRLAAMPIPPEINVFSLPVPLERVIGVATLANSPRTPAAEVFLNLLTGQ
ncbi:MAG: LysR family transcriptional regulator [Cyanothece sp. SIO2G6]|nr:LysR family transcriptional regulator [Cyanothece sp. SIO2G6]